MFLLNRCARPNIALRRTVLEAALSDSFQLELVIYVARSTGTPSRGNHTIAHYWLRISSGNVLYVLQRTNSFDKVFTNEINLSLGIIVVT